MKKVLCVAIALVIASSAMAQVLQVAQTAGPTEVGQISATAGIVKFMGDTDKGENGAMILGARCSYGVIENLLLIGDIGYAMDYGIDDVIALAIAGQYSLAMLELPVDLAVRLGYSCYDMELSDGGWINLMVTASKQIEQVDGLAVYGGLGYAMCLNSDVDGEFLASLGVSYAIASVENLSVYGEVSLLDSLGIGAGATYKF